MIPIFFPGMHARDYLGLEPIAQAVQELEKESDRNYRCSIVCFVVPRRGITVKEDYVAEDSYSK